MIYPQATAPNAAVNPTFGMGLGLGKGGGGSSWTPAQLTGLVATVHPALSFAASKLWQDTGQTTLVTATGQNVGAIQCTFTGVVFKAATANLPTLGGSGGKFWLAFPSNVTSYRLTVQLGSPASASAWWVGMSGVDNAVSGDTAATPWDMRNSGSGTPLLNLASGWTLINGRVSSLVTTTPAGAGLPSGWQTHEALWDGTTLSYLRAGSTVGSIGFNQGALALDRIGVGDGYASGGPINGNLSCQLIAAGAQTAGNLTAARTYMNATHP